MLFEYVPMEDDIDNDIETVNFAENFDFPSRGTVNSLNNVNATINNTSSMNKKLRGNGELMENLLSLQKDNKKYSVLNLGQTINEEATV
jgi:hypothetical protein